MKMSLKSMANKAKDRLLSRGLRDFYCNGAIAATGFYNNMNFNNKDKKDEDVSSETPVSFSLKDDPYTYMTNKVRERYILECVKKYQEEKHRAVQRELLCK